MKTYAFLLFIALLALSLCFLPAGLVAHAAAESPAPQIEAVAGIVAPSSSADLLGDLVAFLTAAGVVVGMGYATRDNAFKNTKALPNGAATVAGDGFNLGLSSKGELVVPCELRIEAPALATADLPNTETMTYSVYHAESSDYSDEVLLYGSVLVQTGAGGAGAAAKNENVRLPVDVSSYVRVKATNSGAGDASDKSFTTRLVF